MGKIDDTRAWNEWREYYRALKRDKAVDSLSPVERAHRLEKLEKDPIAWMLFFLCRVCPISFHTFPEEGHPTDHLQPRVVRGTLLVA